MAFKFSKIFSKRKEVVDPQPHSQRVGFSKPLSLEQRVQQAVRAEMLNREFSLNQKFDPAGFDDFERPEFESPHELTMDPESGEEITKAQLSSRQQARAEFDDYVAEVKKKKAAEAAKEVKSQQLLRPKSRIRRPPQELDHEKDLSLED